MAIAERKIKNGDSPPFSILRKKRRELHVRSGILGSGI
jgi:hypothetical protein